VNHNDALGLVPFWSKDAQIGFNTINAKAKRSPRAQRSVRHGNVEGCLCQPVVLRVAADQ